MHTLPKLSYAYDALEPHIDAQTMEIHHTKHHQTYVDKLNDALKKAPDLEQKPLEELYKNLNQIPDEIRVLVRNHGGGHLNHSLFWQLMTPGGANQPSGSLAEKITELSGNFENFKNEFATTANGRFGSGWAWLVVGQKGHLIVMSTANQDNPLMDGYTPILGLDVWEHAYYLKYQSKRADYVMAWWNVVNWDMVQQLFEAASKQPK